MAGNSSVLARLIVTGVSDHSVGGQICKALALGRPKSVVAATNLLESEMRGLPFNCAHVLPRCPSDGYLAAVLDLAGRTHAEFIAPGSEPELDFLSRNREALQQAGPILLANTAAIIESCINKNRTFSVLAEKGIRVPRTIADPLRGDPAAFERHYPWIIKPAKGSGTVGVAIAQNPQELDFFCRYLVKLGMEPIAQEYFGRPEDEYTVGVLHSSGGVHLGSFAIRRNILNGLSLRLKVPNTTARKDLGPWLAISSGITQGEISTFAPVLADCLKISEALGSRGPLNIQGRWDGRSFMPFEINPRFSGTTSMRAMAGFNEPVQLIRSYLEMPVRRSRVKVQGVFSDDWSSASTRARGKDESGMNDFDWDVGRLPFYYRPLPTPTNGHSLPDFLPFCLTVCGESGLLMQRQLAETQETLCTAYREGVVIAGGTDESESGAEYAENVLGFIFSTVGRDLDAGFRVLDIGCGTGYLLYRLKKAGAEVLGIEPGSYGRQGESRYGVPIIHDFFPFNGLTGRFDLVIMHMVLEHMEDPLETLRQISGILEPGGTVVVSVEDEQSYIDSGDPSILFHEHYSYFTEKTLSNCLELAGFRVTNLHKPGFSRILYASAAPGTASAAVADGELERCRWQAERYRTKCLQSRLELSCYFQTAHERQETVGVYAPARAINILSMLDRIPTGLRFFDDNPSLHGTYFPGFAVPIENRSQLLAHPPERLLVMSGSFGKRIIESIPEETRKRMLVTGWEDVFSPRLQGEGNPRQSGSADRKERD